MFSNRPADGEWLSVYVPAPGTVSAMTLAPGSAVVAYPLSNASGKVHAYYEGNIYNAENMRHFEDRAKNAYGRLTHRYPTIAQMMVDEKDLIEVGQTDGKEVQIHNMDAIKQWMPGFEPKPPEMTPWRPRMR